MDTVYILIDHYCDNCILGVYRTKDVAEKQANDYRDLWGNNDNKDPTKGYFVLEYVVHQHFKTEFIFKEKLCKRTN